MSLVVTKKLKIHIPSHVGNHKMHNEVATATRESSNKAINSPFCASVKLIQRIITPWAMTLGNE